LPLALAVSPAFVVRAVTGLVDAALDRVAETGLMWPLAAGPSPARRQGCPLLVRYEVSPTVMALLQAGLSLVVLVR